MVAALAHHGTALDRVVLSRAADSAQLLEKVFRCLSIALANELKTTLQPVALTSGSHLAGENEAFPLHTLLSIGNRKRHGGRAAVVSPARSLRGPLVVLVASTRGSTVEQDTVGETQLTRPMQLLRTIPTVSRTGSSLKHSTYLCARPCESRGLR